MTTLDVSSRLGPSSIYELQKLRNLCVYLFILDNSRAVGLSQTAIKSTVSRVSMTKHKGGRIRAVNGTGTDLVQDWIWLLIQIVVKKSKVLLFSLNLIFFALFSFPSCLSYCLLLCLNIFVSPGTIYLCCCSSFQNNKKRRSPDVLWITSSSFDWLWSWLLLRHT